MSGIPRISALPANSAVAIELSPLRSDPERLRATWLQLLDQHQGRKVTAKVVAEAVRLALSPDLNDDLDGAPEDAEGVIPHTRPLADWIDLVVSNTVLAMDWLTPLGDVPAEAFVAKYQQCDPPIRKAQLNAFISWLLQMRHELEEAGHFAEESDFRR